MESKTIRINAIKSNVGHVQLAKLLFGQYVFIAKSVNKTSYSDCNTVWSTECRAMFVQFYFYRALNEPLFKSQIISGKGFDIHYCNIYINVYK